MNALKKDYLDYLTTASHLAYLFADPPWKFSDRPPKLRGQTSFTLWKDNTAGVQSLFGGCQKAGVDLVWLWCPVSLLDIPVRWSREFGYQYKTTAVWRKLTRKGKEFYGCGHWLRNSIEFLVLFVRLFHERKALRCAHRNLWSFPASKGATAKPRLMELDIIEAIHFRYGKSTKGAYLFSGSDIKCFAKYDLDCVDIVL